MDAKEIRALRERLGDGTKPMPRAQFAALLKVDASTVFKWEKGSKPGRLATAALDRLAKSSSRKPAK